MISNNVHILSDADYEYEIEKSFQRGVKRGKFESLADVTPARIAGLREAAEMLCKRAEIKREQADHAFEADDEADQHGYSHAAFCLQQEADAILARIAELEKP